MSKKTNAVVVHRDDGSKNGEPPPVELKDRKHIDVQVPSFRDEPAVLPKPLNGPVLAQTTEGQVATTDLALIAASLRRAGSSQDWGGLASDALDLWEACAKEIRERLERRRNRFNEICAGLPDPDRYPVPLKDFLRLILPKRRLENCFEHYRHFLMAWMKFDLSAAGDLLASHKAKPADRHEFRRRAFLFQAWIEVDFRCGKRLNGLKGNRNLSREQIAAEEKAAAEECQRVVEAAEDRWNDALVASLRGLV